jgi:hypothetical protein
MVEAISNAGTCNQLTSPPPAMETKNRRQPKGTVIIGKGAAIVRPSGMQCFTGPKPFVTWTEIVGKKITDAFRASTNTGVSMVPRRSCSAVTI